MTNLEYKELKHLDKIIFSNETIINTYMAFIKDSKYLVKGHQYKKSIGFFVEDERGASIRLIEYKHYFDIIINHKFVNFDY